MALPENRPSNFHWPSFIQLVLSVIGVLILWGLAFLFLLAGGIQIARADVAPAEITQMLLLSAGLVFSGALLLPSAAYSLLRLMDRPEPILPAWLQALGSPGILILILPVVIGLGYLVSQQAQLAWLALPPLHIVAVGLPVAWLVHLGRRGLQKISPQPAWGIFGAGLVLGPAIILVLEILAGVFFLVIGMVYLSTQPQLVDDLRRLQSQIETLSGDPEELVNLLIPYLSDPFVIISLFVFVAGVVPLIEEALKPVGVWLFASKLDTPAKGFAAGLLSGAGFALFENLAYSSMGGQWAETVLLRVGAGLLHIITAGLMGWALVLAWKSQRYGRLALAYLTVVLLHGLWNGLALLTAAVAVRPEAEQLVGVSAGAAIGLLLTAGIMFVVLLASNRSLRTQPVNPPGAGYGLDRSAD